MGVKLKEPPKEEEVVEEPKEKKTPGKESVNFDFNTKTAAATKENKIQRSQSQKRLDKKSSQMNDEEEDDGYIEGVFLPKQPPLHEILNVNIFKIILPFKLLHSIKHKYRPNKIYLTHITYSLKNINKSKLYIKIYWFNSYLN